MQAMLRHCGYFDKSTPQLIFGLVARCGEAGVQGLQRLITYRPRHDDTELGQLGASATYVENMPLDVDMQSPNLLTHCLR